MVRNQFINIFLNRHGISENTVNFAMTSIITQLPNHLLEGFNYLMLIDIEMQLHKIFAMKGLMNTNTMTVQKNVDELISNHKPSLK